ncbi:putative splicing arginine serine-rich 7 isoform X2 [Brachionus plicatilis]|uniref:Putative splicing arginine serine-rich 7 isoform X2 n=1 Tax=Brachionus plicatilis TaxID=10195 RepID=A0A3M7R5H7_BRAPC|nr:putative splicing arginine serine-rich 7 isoform X2 [Brachionus plicatilis]
MSTRLIQVTNVPTSVTREQFRALFSNLGRIDDIVIYPESESKASSVAAKVGYVKFTSSETAQAALNLTSTVYIDRPLLISLVKPSSSSSSARIPEESSALKFCAPLNTNIVLLPNGPTWSHKVINRKVTIQAKDDKPATTYIETKDSNLTDRSLPDYPNLPGSTDPAKAEEIRRTVFVSNLDPRVSLENLYDFFSQIGEIKYVRMTKSVNNVEYENLGHSSERRAPEGVDLENDSVGAVVEFSEQPSVVKALCLNGFKFAEREIKVNHCTQTVQIPESKKEQINVDDIKKDKKKSESHKAKHVKREKHGGSASDGSLKSSDEADLAVEPSPPRKQKRSSRSRSQSKSKSKPARRSRSKEKDRKERDRDKKRSREREKSGRSHSGVRSSNKKRKDDKEKDRDRDKEREREKERSSNNKKDKKEKRRS